jgi:nucleoid DNA-binding protein
MNKTQLVSRMAKLVKVPKAKAERLLDALIQAIY